MVHPYNPATGAAPFESLKVADIGDIAINPYHHKGNVGLIRKGIASILATGCKPLVMGGDHTVSYPILQAIKVRKIPRPPAPESPKSDLKGVVSASPLFLFTSGDNKLNCLK